MNKPANKPAKLTFKPTIDYRDFIDDSIQPKEDFYSRMANKWIADNPLPATEARWGCFSYLNKLAITSLKRTFVALPKKPQANLSPVESRVKDFYAAALDVDNHEQEAKKVLVEMLASIRTANNLHDMCKVFGSLQKLGVSAPWDTVIDADELDSSAYVVRIVQSGLTLPEKDYYSGSETEYVGFRAQFAKHISRIYKLAPESSAELKVFKKSILNIENRLAKISRTSVQLRDVMGNYNAYTYDELKARFPSANWAGYFAAMYWEPVGKIVVNQPEFVDFVLNDVAKNIAEWQEYLTWHVLYCFAGTISSRHAKANFQFFGKALAGSKKMKPLWRRALNSTSVSLGEDVGQLYVAKYFPKSSKGMMTELVEQLRTAFGQRIQALDWMNSETKEKALQKLTAVDVMIGNPDEWRDYSSIKVSDVHINNIVTSVANEQTYQLSKPGTRLNRTDWDMTPQTVNAYCDHNRLVIVFPAAILQTPFFDPKASIAANMGGIGAVIGHELTHMFDDMGSQFDHTGTVNPWIVGAEKLEFDRRNKVMIDCASNYEVLPGLNMKGELVVGEAVADLGGAEIAYSALTNVLDAKQATEQEKLDASKEFFAINALTSISSASDEYRRQSTVADPHPDDPFRVNGTFTHMDSFYATYDIPVNSQMYTAPEKRVSIW